MISDEELSKLAKSIASNGLRVPILLHEGEILDGRNRYEAWCGYCGERVTREEFSQLRIAPSGEPAVIEYQGHDPLEHVLALNMHRRHLTSSQRAALAAEIANLDLGANQHSQGDQNFHPLLTVKRQKSWMCRKVT